MIISDKMIKPPIIKSALLLLLILNLNTISWGQNSMGIGTNSPNPNAVLDLVSSGNNQGFLVPRLNTTERTTLASSLLPTDVGLMLYDTDDNAFYFWDGTSWIDMSSGGGSPFTIPFADDATTIAFGSSTIIDAGAGAAIEAIDDNVGGGAVVGAVSYSSDPANNSSALTVVNSRGTQAVPLPLQSGDIIGELVFNGAIGGVDMFEKGASIEAVAAETYSPSGVGSDLSFFTTPNTTISAVERMRITNDGNIGINTISPTSDLQIFDDFHIFHFNDGSMIEGEIIAENVSPNGTTLEYTKTGPASFIFQSQGEITFLTAPSAVAGSDAIASSFSVLTLQSDLDAEFRGAVEFGDFMGAGLPQNGMIRHTGGDLEGHVLGAWTSLTSGSGIMMPTTGSTVIGTNAGPVLSGNFNTFLGEDAGSTTTTGASNTFLGYQSGQANIDGGSNTFVGGQAGNQVTSGSNNTALGFNSGNGNTTGSGNTNIGFQAGFTTAAPMNDNTFLGNQAGRLNTADENTFIGSRAGRNNTGASRNVFVGFEAGFTNAGSNNTFLGWNAGRANPTGLGNTYVGASAGVANTLGDNTFVGANAGTNIDGSENVIVGSDAGSTGTTGSQNVFIGRNAGVNNTASQNVFMGTRSGEGNTTGVGNTFIGHGVGVINTTGQGNVYLGHSAGFNNNGNDNTFIGTQSGELMTNNIQNTIIGSQAGNSGVGDENTYIGYNAAASNTNGDQNVVIGAVADVADGILNVTVIGTAASAGQDGAVAIGGGADAQNRNSVAIGVNAVASGLRSVAIGQNVTATMDSTIILWDSNQFKVGIGTNNPNQLLTVNGNASKPGGGSFLTFSDQRMKRNIRSFTDGMATLKKIDPVRFKYNGKGGYDDDGKEYVGVIAQDIQKVAPYMVETINQKLNPEDKEKTDLLMYDGDALTYILVNAVKEQQVIIEELKSSLGQLSAEIERIKSQGEVNIENDIKSSQK